MTRRTRARGVLGVALVALGLLPAMKGVLATVTDAATSGAAVVESAVVPSASTAGIGDLVFDDRDHDGRRDPAEPGVAGAEVDLLDADGRPARTDAGTLVPATVTDASGAYEFADLAAGAYRVRVGGLPPGARFTDPSGEPDVDDDSDADPATGTTAVIDLAAGEHDATIDVGLFLPAPELTVSTRVRGLDADAAPGPTIPEGTQVGFDYLVTNTGNERLVDLVVTDDQGVSVTCPQTSVAIGQIVACAGVSTETTGTHVNLGLAVASGADSAIAVSADDPAHHAGGPAGLVVDERVQGVDADVATEAVQVPAGSPVTYTLAVTNDSNEPVAGISLDEVGGGALSCPATELAPSEVMVCAPRTLPAPVGLTTDVVTVSGRSAGSGTPLADTDAANVFGRDSRLALLKEAYDPARRTYLDADADAGSPGSDDGVAAVLDAGATGRYRLQLTNTGNVDLPGASVVDDGCDGPVGVVFGDHGSTGTLEVGEAWTLRCQRADLTESFTNTAEATASGVTAHERAQVTVSTTTTTTTSSTTTSTTLPTTSTTLLPTTSTTLPSSTSTTSTSVPRPPGGGPGTGPGATGGPSTPPGHLPTTGADVLGLWITGLSLIGLGLLLLWSGRRRRRGRPASEAAPT